MIGFGTLINTAAVVAGGLIGLKLKNGIKQNMQAILMQACGVATIFIGGSGALSKMLVFQDGKFETQGTMLLIFSLVLGSLLGEWIDIEKKMDILGEKIKKAVKAEKDNLFVEGFVNVSLIICVGAMAIVGAIQDGIRGDYSLLTAKAILDFVIVVVFAAVYGIGAVFSAVPILVYQGAITLAAAFLGSFVSDVIVSDLSFIGSALIFCVGINIGFGKKFKVGNMLPALAVPIIYELIYPVMN
ncbi:DUF554 domain-containing protein [bacterium 1xD42-62]|uniref:DUF554 domain-containing protein n=2 Tax=Parablautia muri TaxID=2320879 RepID=A0A9X5GTJ1_9FIRM|nr:DUF554 domain-containing protein [Parablautia muri]